MWSVLTELRPLNEAQIETLPQPEKSQVEKAVAQTKQTSIARFPILPAILLICYVGLLLLFNSRGSYKQVSITAK